MFHNVEHVFLFINAVVGLFSGLVCFGYHVVHKNVFSKIFIFSAIVCWYVGTVFLFRSLDIIDLQASTDWLRPVLPLLMLISLLFAIALWGRKNGNKK